MVRCTEGEWMLRLICSLRWTQRLISTDNSLDSMKAATMAMSTVEHDTLNLMSPAHSPHRCSALQSQTVSETVWWGLRCGSPLGCVSVFAVDDTSLDASRSTTQLCTSRHSLSVV